MADVRWITVHGARQDKVLGPFEIREHAGDWYTFTNGLHKLKSEVFKTRVEALNALVASKQKDRHHYETRIAAINNDIEDIKHEIKLEEEANAK